MWAQNAARPKFPGPGLDQHAAPRLQRGVELERRLKQGG